VRRLPAWLLAVILAACAGPGAAYAAWSGTGAASGQVQAATMPAGSAPAVSAVGHSVTVSWSGGTLLGQSITGYTVKRDNAGGNAQTIGSGCSGIIAALSCTESSVPAGTWTYTVTPLLYGWTGTESAASSAVTIQSPALSITSATTVTSLPTTVSASLSGYAAGQTVTFKLDSAAGTALTSTLSPTSIPASGAATATITLPAGTVQGAHTIYAVGSPGDAATAAVTVNRPVVSTAAIAKSAGGDAGAIKKGGAYYVYANLTGSGSPPAGLRGVAADVSAITAGQSAAALSAGSYTVAGQSYNYRSAQLTATSTLAAGTSAFTVSLTDTAGTGTTTSYSVTVDNTAPGGTDVQTANVSGGTTGKPELGDTVTYTLSEPIDPNSVLTGWSGSSQSVVAEIVDGGSHGDDKLEVLDAATMAQLPLGIVDLGRNDYVSTTTTFGASGTAATMVLSASAITVTLGTPSAAAGTAAGTGTLIWTPASSVTDPAGNPMGTAAAHESGTADKDF
jgi:hypothetical protein